MAIGKQNRQQGAWRALPRRGLVHVMVTVLPLLLMGLAPASVDAATSTRPDFKLPFVCDATATTTTYAGHGSALDLTDPAGRSATVGKAVLASAAGRVSRVYDSGHGFSVLIDHGGGWASRYLHIAQVRVSQGQYVGEGEMIAAIGDGYSPDPRKWDGPHLHYEQLRDGTMTQIVFDAVNASANTTYRSTNCLPGRAGFHLANRLVRAPDGTIDYVTVHGERYWVPNQDVVRCLQNQGVRLYAASTSVFNSVPRNEYGDPAGRWAGCTTWSTGWMIKGSGSAVWYHAPNGLRYHVPNEATVMCLGGWAAVRSISDAQLSQVPPNPWGKKADCQVPLYGKMVKGTGAAVYFIGPRGTRYHVPSSSIVNCIGGWNSVVNVRDGKLAAIPGDTHGIKANCNSALFDRVVRKGSGQYDYVSGAAVRYWIPNHDVTACLGGKASAVYLHDSRFNAIPRNATNAWASCNTKNL